MGRERCDGYVTTLVNQNVLFTGKTYFNGEHVTKGHLRTRVYARGGANAPGSSRWVTLLVLGDLSGQHVVDPVNSRSQKLIDVYSEREAGNHICVVDSEGISDLLDGGYAHCLETKRVDRGTIEVSRSDDPPPAPSILGGVLTPRAIPDHDPTGMAVDLAALDRGTAAHEALADALRAHGVKLGFDVKVPGIGMPLFDAGWTDPVDASIVYIAELKSLTGAVETQQIRLGIGQVLDYVNTVPASSLSSDQRIVPVVILQHEPADPRWGTLAEALAMIISWAPDFPGI